MKNPVLSPTVAANYGSFIRAAYSMFKPGVVNPPPSNDFPTGYKLIATIQMSDFFGECITREFYGFVAYSETDDEVVIAVRGTDSLTEWWDDFHVSLVPFTLVANGGLVAEGFFDIYKTFGLMRPGAPKTKSVASTSFAQDLLNILEQHTKISNVAQSSFVITGHSLGGALVTLMTVEVAAQSGVKPTVYTFASPRVGNPQFVQLFNSCTSQSWRIYNQYDIVPTLPPKFLGYQSVKVEYELIPTGVRPTLGCEHELTTYLFLLDPTNYHLPLSCQY